MTAIQLDFGDRDTRVLVGLINVYARDGRATVRGLADELGMGVTTVHTALASLASEGLVAVGVNGGLRPLVERVA